MLYNYKLIEIENEGQNTFLKRVFWTSIDKFYMLAIKWEFFNHLKYTWNPFSSFLILLWHKPFKNQNQYAIKNKETNNPKDLAKIYPFLSISDLEIEAMENRLKWSNCLQSWFYSKCALCLKILK